MFRDIKPKSKKKSFLILSKGIDPLELVLIVLSFVGILVLVPLLETEEIFVSLRADTNKILWYYLAFPFVFIVILWEKRGLFWQKKRKVLNFLLFLVGNIALIMLAQIIPTFILVGFTPQSVAANVTLLFVATAIAEEFFFRVFMIGFFQYLITKFFSQINSVAKRKENMIALISGFIFVIISSLTFALAHTNYYGNNLIVIITLVTGLVQGVMFLWHRDMLIIFISHAIINILAVQNLIAHL